MTMLYMLQNWLLDLSFLAVVLLSLNWALMLWSGDKKQQKQKHHNPTKALRSYLSHCIKRNSIQSLEVAIIIGGHFSRS